MRLPSKNSTEGKLRYARGNFDINIVTIANSQSGAQRSSILFEREYFMHIGIIGATGNIGQRILAEALGRGHQVTAFTRHESHIGAADSRVTWQVVDVLDSESVVSVIGGLDVLISGYQPGNASKNLSDTLERSIRNPNVYVTAAKALLKAMEKHLRLRLIVIGGAGRL